MLDWHHVKLGRLWKGQETIPWQEVAVRAWAELPGLGRWGVPGERGGSRASAQPHDSWVTGHSSH